MISVIILTTLWQTKMAMEIHPFPKGNASSNYVNGGFSIAMLVYWSVYIYNISYYILRSPESGVIVSADSVAC